MQRLIVDTSARSSDLRYACPFQAPGDAVVFLKGTRQCWLVVPMMERQRAQAALHPVGGIVWTPAELALDPLDRRRVSAWALGLLQKLKIREVAVARDFPIAVADTLRRHRVHVEVVPERLFPERAVKNAAELACCRASQRAATAAMRAAATVIHQATVDSRGRLWHARKRLTSERVRCHIDAVLHAHDCTGTDTIVACGPDSALPHHRGAGVLWAGCPIIVDVFPSHRRHGYHGDLTRTLVWGPVPARLRRMLTAVRAAQQAALRAVRAGVSAASVHTAAEKTFAQMGMRVDAEDDPARGFIHSTGHGLGLDVHEAPWIGRNKDRLRAGQVITIEPGWYEPGFGGVRIEDAVVVTSCGYELLARCAIRSVVGTPAVKTD